jgi:hypothetical protein
VDAQLRAQRQLWHVALMPRMSEEIQTIVDLLRQAGHDPEVTVGSHIKIKVPGLPQIICAKTPSDRRGALNALARTKRIIKSASCDERIS